MIKPVMPLPGDTTPHGTVIASVWQRDDEDPIFALLMVLQPEPPYYGIYQITWKNQQWEYLLLEEHVNINPATEAYADNGGDW